MWPETKWLDIIKATGPQSLAITAASGVFLLLDIAGAFGAMADWVRPSITFLFLLSFFLALVAFVQALQIQNVVRALLRRRAAKEAVRRYIPHMTRREREIVGYLLSRNQKIFVAATDGGYANTLMTQGIVKIALRPGQVFEDDQVPMCIPDDVWEVLLEFRKEFPIGDPRPDEPHPWRIPWMAR